MKNEIWSWIGDLSQLPELNTMSYVVAEQRGTEAFDVRTGAGLAFTVVKDRALDIAWASYRTLRSLLSPQRCCRPRFFESQGNEQVLRSFTRGY